LAVTRVGETKLIGGDIGPELSKVGSKVNPDWLVAWLRARQAHVPHSKMPRYQARRNTRRVSTLEAQLNRINTLLCGSK